MTDRHNEHHDHPPREPEHYHHPNEEGSTWKPKWINRRTVIFTALTFCALTVVYCLWKGEDTKIAETAITMSYFLAGSIIGSYVFGAAYENVGISKKR